ALRLLENLAALLARVDGSLDAWHRLPDPEQLLDRLHVGLVHRHRLAEAALTLRRLLLEQVAAHRRPAHHLARSGHLEPLLRCALSLCLRHLVSSLPRSSSVRAASSCSVRRGAAAARSGRSRSRPPPAASAGPAHAPGASSRGPGT